MMIDLHSHVLHGLDDGPETIEESIQMCWICHRDGVERIVATPHTLNGEYQNNRSTILAKVKELNDALISNNSGLRTPKSELRILPGADVHFSNEILVQLDEGEVMTVGDGRKFLILEFPFHAISFRAEDLLFQLLAKGITPIISHPERNLEIVRRPTRYYEMVKMGCLGQVTAMSVTGGFGSKVRGFVEKLFKKRLLHFIASDAHNINGRPPGLTHAVREAEKIVGREEAQKMVTEYPKSVLEGKRPDVPEPLPL